MKTIIQFIHELGDGGASALVKDYAIRLKEDGYRVVVLMVFPDNNSVNLKTILKNQIEVRYVFPNKNIVNRLKNKLANKFFVSKKIKCLVRDLQPIAFHAHLEVLHLVKPASKALGGVKLVYTCHNEPSIMIGGKETAEYKAASYLLRNNNMQMIALHPDMANEINGLFGISNTTVINNGINIQRFLDTHINVVEYRRSIGIPEDAFVVGHVGRFHRVKNHRFLIDVFDRLVKKQPKSHLLLIGTGELQGQIEKQLKENNLSEKATILTHRTDIPELMRVMDVFVFPSLYEGLGIVLIEAQIVGLKCVISSAIPKHSIISNRVSVLDLNVPKDDWQDLILTPSKEVYYCNYSQWDINHIVHKLENIYEQI